MSTFEGVIYYLTETLSPFRRSELAHVLDIEGATAAGTLDEATHIVTKSAEFQGFWELRDDVAVVTELWVEHSVILGGAQPPQYYSADSAKFFSGVVACSADLPPCDIEIVSGAITALGGQWRLAYTRDVTHLFALTPTTDRYQTAVHHQAITRVIILTPHWFDDAVLFGQYIPTAAYEWPNPAVLRSALRAPDSARVEEMEDTAKRTRVAGQQRAMSRTVLMSPGPEVEMKDTWGGRRILLSTSLELTSGRRGAVEAGIERMGGVMVKYESQGGDGNPEEEAILADEADVLVTRYRAGWAYTKAYRSKKMIGTLAWLYNVESTGILSAPMDQLLHYPLPSTPIEGFHSHEITVTNYTGEAREYLKCLISAMGATFTSSMSLHSTTIVVAAFIGGPKTDKAVPWSIPIVNHTWLEDCFAAWRKLTPAMCKYIYFPPNVDFQDMLGERGVGRVVLDDKDLAALEADVAVGSGVGEEEGMGR